MSWSTIFGAPRLLSFISWWTTTFERLFYNVPGSAVVARYVKSSHQNDPGRTLLEVILIIFTIRTLLQSRTRADRNGQHYEKFSPKEIDELVDDWNPEPLAQPLNAWDNDDLADVPVIAGSHSPKPVIVETGRPAVNLASFNFTGLSGNEQIKNVAIETLRKYGLGSCGPPGFYGTLDVHMQLERDIADFLGTEAAILYSQGFSTISSVIPAFCKRGDIIVADQGVNFAIQKGIQISRSTVKWFEHNDLKSLEGVLASEHHQAQRKELTRRFIITEGIFERDGLMLDLPRLIEMKQKYKYRLILDESISFGSVGRTGRGLTELYDVPVKEVDILIGSIANSLCSSGGFCAGSQTMVDHQRINGPAFVFSASTPALLAASASQGISILRRSPTIFSKLRANIHAARSILEQLDCITVPSHPASPIIHICVSPGMESTPRHSMILPSSSLDKPDFHTQERLLQDVVMQCRRLDVLVTRAARLRGQDSFEGPPSIRLALSSALSTEETVKAVSILKAVLVNTLAKQNEVIDADGWRPVVREG